MKWNISFQINKAHTHAYINTYTIPLKEVENTYVTADGYLSEQLTESFWTFIYQYLSNTSIFLFFHLLVTFSKCIFWKYHSWRKTPRFRVVLKNVVLWCLSLAHVLNVCMYIFKNYFHPGWTYIGWWWEGNKQMITTDNQMDNWLYFYCYGHHSSQKKNSMEEKFIWDHGVIMAGKEELIVAGVCCRCSWGYSHLNRIGNTTARTLILCSDLLSSIGTLP